MLRLRTLIGNACCAVLIWMSVAAGYFPAAAQSEFRSPVRAPISHGSPDLAHSHNGHGSGHHGMVHASKNPLAECIATCLDLVSHKLVPKAAASDLKPDKTPVAVEYRQFDALVGPQRLALMAYWPTGPPGSRELSGHGAARLVAINARLRI